MIKPMDRNLKHDFRFEDEVFLDLKHLSTAEWN